MAVFIYQSTDQGGVRCPLNLLALTWHQSAADYDVLSKLINPFRHLGFI